MRVRSWLPLMVVLMLGRGARADLAEAEVAIRELRYEDARQELTRLVEGGGLGRETLLEVLALAAETSSVLDGPEAGERDYRRLLALDPTRSAPRRDTPVFRIPFERAQRWVEATGKLEVAVAAPGSGGPRAVIRVAHDPLALVWGLRVWTAQAATRTFVAGAKVMGTSAPLPAPAPDGTMLHYIDVIDEHGNQLLTLGSPSQPLRWSAPSLVASKSEAPPPRRLWRPGLGITVAGVLVLGAGIGFDAAAVSEFDALRGSCAPGCTPGMLDTLHTDQALAGTFYALGGAALVVGATLVIIDAVRARRHPDRTLSLRPR